jgi:hypothetical protein
MKLKEVAGVKCALPRAAIRYLMAVRCEMVEELRCSGCGSAELSPTRRKEEMPLKKDVRVFGRGVRVISFDAARRDGPRSPC